MFDAAGVAFVDTLLVGVVDAFGESVGVDVNDSVLQTSFPEEFFLHTT